MSPAAVLAARQLHVPLQQQVCEFAVPLTKFPELFGAKTTTVSQVLLLSTAC